MKYHKKIRTLTRQRTLKTTEEYILEGNQYYQKYKFEKAIEAYEKAIEIDLDSV
jgi:tetratricopeptide (TPR) repeat protein